MLDLMLLAQAAGAVVGCVVVYFVYHLATSPKTVVVERDPVETGYQTPRCNHLPFPSIDDEPTIHLSVIVPCYNEQDRLPAMMDEACEFLKDKPWKWEIIIVNDGSKDQTNVAAIKYTDIWNSLRVRLLIGQKNRGKGGAIRLGMMSARGKYLLMADADGATRFSDLDKLFASLPEGERSMAVGSRAHMESESIAERSFVRTILMKGFHLIVWLLCVRSVRDSQCGFKLFTRDAARVCFANLHVERWAFDVELLYIAERLKIPVAEVAVNWKEVDGSKIVPFFTWLQMGRDILLIWLHYFLNLWTIKDNK